MKNFGEKNLDLDPTPITEEEGRRLLKEAEDRDQYIAREILHPHGKRFVEIVDPDYKGEYKPENIFELATDPLAEEVSINTDEAGDGY